MGTEGNQRAAFRALALARREGITFDEAAGRLGRRAEDLAQAVGPALRRSHGGLVPTPKDDLPRRMRGVTDSGVENLKVERLILGADTDRDNVYTIRLQYAARCWVRDRPATADLQSATSARKGLGLAVQDPCRDITWARRDCSRSERPLDPGLSLMGCSSWAVPRRESTGGAGGLPGRCPWES